MTEMICILCPTGCRLKVRRAGAGTGLEVGGAACDRGKQYAESEWATPSRVFTGTVRVLGARQPVVAVKSDQPVPRDDLIAVARRTALVAVEAPVEIGRVVAANLPGGAKLVTTAAVEASQPK